MGDPGQQSTLAHMDDFVSLRVSVVRVSSFLLRLELVHTRRPSWVSSCCAHSRRDIIRPVYVGLCIIPGLPQTDYACRYSGMTLAYIVAQFSYRICAVSYVICCAWSQSGTGHESRLSTGKNVRGASLRLLDSLFRLRLAATATMSSGGQQQLRFRWEGRTRAAMGLGVVLAAGRSPVLLREEGRYVSGRGHRRAPRGDRCRFALTPGGKNRTCLQGGVVPPRLFPQAGAVLWGSGAAPATRPRRAKARPLLTRPDLFDVLRSAVLVSVFSGGFPCPGLTLSPRSRI
ncbi:hypothetical protein NDU88_006199 [Pleurodeles waltl]|uniref:Uncharacterized protein n=1 Tax=Pleurodeles waltl TaxID=8319 RepID=A0AAV7LND2_PLEWA|nr:hypothetical protein NDU88_006199 [Pleurodeles waltl]